MYWVNLFMLMKGKKFICIVFTIIFLLSSISNVFADAYCDNVPIFIQAYDGLCWAVSASMVAAHYHDDVIDRTEDICWEIKKAYPAYGESLDDIIKGIQYGLKIPTESPVKPAKYQTYGVCSETAIKYQFNNNAPIVARIQPQGIGRHAVVLRYYIDGSSINEDKVGYNDPMDGSHLVKYTEFTKSWVDSIIFS
ncbi:papain-like cysteine protease family protein [Caldanaerobius fijiensis]|nr:papain-like cysteine protease family protein [Caldanaerobius fijiensis]